MCFFFSSRRRHTRCALVTGVQTCALPISQMGFKYFALTHHVEVTRRAANVVRIHNYPSQWVAYHDRNALGTSDPVHRASHMSCAGFLWSEMKTMIPLNSDDRRDRKSVV